MVPITDNVAITAGTGTSIATDDIGGVQWQRVKIGHGSDGSAVDASATNPLPVTAPAATRVTHSIAVAHQTDALMNAAVTLTPKFVSLTVTASQTDSQVIAAVTSKKLRVISMVNHCAGTGTSLTLESGTATRIHKANNGANGGEVLPFNPLGWFETAAGAALTATTGAGSDTELTITYVEV